MEQPQANAELRCVFLVFCGQYGPMNNWTGYGSLLFTCVHLLGFKWWHKHAKTSVTALPTRIHILNQVQRYVGMEYISHLPGLQFSAKSKNMLCLYDRTSVAPKSEAYFQRLVQRCDRRSNAIRGKWASAMFTACRHRPCNATGQDTNIQLSS
jgi:hypothetical protein